ncbi:MAG: drug:proton antiporter [Hoeflea sp.]|nr:drug:proton antiporter [Hoeflea sp.]|tara:strand:+ start:6228 stop:6596 length:369 start_codon:yes stop_codon:yes gene_type:complete
MASPNLIIRYVDDARVSADFYAKLLDVEASFDGPVFASVPFHDGVRLAFWNRPVIHPAVTTPGEDGEICLKADTADALDTAFADWKAEGITILQEPVDMPFGRTFTAADPDGHRIRMLYREA